MTDPVVLVVDDEPANRAFVHKALSSAGWTVIEADDGESAIAAARSSLPNLIVMDINMQKTDGFAATRCCLHSS